jgi:hypothetical protein
MRRSTDEPATEERCAPAELRRPGRGSALVLRRRISPIGLPNRTINLVRELWGRLASRPNADSR